MAISCVTIYVRVLGYILVWLALHSKLKRTVRNICLESIEHKQMNDKFVNVSQMRGSCF